MAWLDRARTYPECGFMVFDARHPNHMAVMFELRRIYESGDVFELEQTHDSFVIENVIHRMVATDHISDPHNLSGKVGHHTGDPFAMSALSRHMVHLKGRKKYEAR